MNRTANKRKDTDTMTRQRARRENFEDQFGTVNAEFSRGDASIHGYTIPRKARRRIARARAKKVE